MGVFEPTILTTPRLIHTPYYRKNSKSGLIETYSSCEANTDNEQPSSPTSLELLRPPIRLELFSPPIGSELFCLPTGLEPSCPPRGFDHASRTMKIMVNMELSTTAGEATPKHSESCRCESSSSVKMRDYCNDRKEVAPKMT